jgi:hypothetical protein
MTERRRLIIGVIAVLLLAGVVLDRSVDDDAATPVVAAAGPVALAEDGGASTWYCPIANAQPGMQANGTIVIQNTRINAVDGVLTLYPVTGDPVSVALRAPGRARLLASEVEFLKAPVVGAVVEMEQGGVAVEQTVSGPLGESTSPCATEAGDRWYIAEGSTALNHTMHIGLFNPFPDDAIVDLDFATDQGRTAPGAFQGIVVAARSVVAVAVGDHVRRRDHIAATAVARRGRIVVGRLQTRTFPRPGVAVSVAAPAPQTFWDFPDGLVGDNASERFHLYNPSQREATVELALTLDQGAAEPFEIKVPAGERFTLDPGAESRVPKGVGHAATVRSNFPIVAERTLDYTAPAPRIGLSIALGAPAAAQRWLLPQGGLSPTSEEWLVVHNAGRRAARVTVVSTTGGRLERIGGLIDVSIPAGERRTFRLSDSISFSDPSLVVEASQPVVVERVIARIGRPGVSQTIAIPVAE